MNSSKSSSLGRSHPRASELSDPMRRSFATNPFAKPSLIPDPNPREATPSGFPRRNSFGGREGAAASFHRDLDDKENEKDSILKPWKVRSPAASSKCGKNFMSPTVSASSKVGPRKKVLGDRNEPARVFAPVAATKIPTTKVTFAESVHYNSILKSKDGVREKNFEVNVASTLSNELCGEVAYSLNVPCNVKDEAGYSFQTVVDEPDCVNLDPSFKLSPIPTPPLPVSTGAIISAPHDADPLMPPYDPKTNYLTPRPQFLHYKPKQRSDLDDGFVYEDFSDSEVTEDSNLEDDSQKESEDVSLEERVEECPAKTIMMEETVEAKEMPKPRFYIRWKAVIALLLLLSVAFVSMSVPSSQLGDGTVFQDIYGVYESSEFSEFVRNHFDRFSEFAKANFDGLYQNLHTWFTESLSSISKFISNVESVHSLGHLKYCNLTVMHEYNAVDQGLIFGQSKIDIGEASEVYPLVLNVEDSGVASVIDIDEDIEDVSAEHYNSISEEQDQQDLEITADVEKALDDALDCEELSTGQPANVVEPDQDWQLDQVIQPELYHLEADIKLKVQSNVDSQAADVPNMEVFNNGDLDAKQALDSEIAEILTGAYGDNHNKLTEAKEESISMDATSEGDEQRLGTINLQPNMVLYLLLLGGAILLTGAAFNWLSKGKSRSTRVTTSFADQPLFAKSFHAKNSLVTPKQEQNYLERPSLRNEPIQIDMNGESCLSEMSSIHKSSPYLQRLVKESNEVDSVEKKSVAKKSRDSLASSSNYSTSSPSYGSLTVYEKIQIKNGHGSGEKVTPVRRSSRLRSQATSPL
ncbi:hypothetical protein HN51_003790 [Arachis hypogaea]|uniref:Uncharacterized protein n=1 Tax=Arachis hypogaea TaxID=3818 RepID=A0A445DJP8_ARAHY|nr:uncharacterized protein LOC112795917 isoform X1 [Arachis hypogaea]XP_029153569.1 uncharacterized protein LOC112795917 isoform X1 [Arachis hypogaea]RYR63413.1 hypothetical protein Ahy_A04g021213 [Arachis hypogaea]